MPTRNIDIPFKNLAQRYAADVLFYRLASYGQPIFMRFTSIGRRLRPKVDILFAGDPVDLGQLCGGDVKVADGPCAIHAMSSPRVSTFQPGILGCNIAKFVFPQAEGKAALK